MYSDLSDRELWAVITTLLAGSRSPLVPMHVGVIANVLIKMQEEYMRRMIRHAPRDSGDSGDSPKSALSVRTFNALTAWFGKDDWTAVDLAGHTEADLLRVPNLGRRSVNEVIEWLHQHELHLDK